MLFVLIAALRSSRTVLQVLQGRKEFFPWSWNGSPGGLFLLKGNFPSTLLLFIGYFSIVCVFSLNIVGSLSFNIKCLKATAMGNWSYINKSEMNPIKNSVEPQSLLQPGEGASPGSETVWVGQLGMSLNEFLPTLSLHFHLLLGGNRHQNSGTGKDDNLRGNTPNYTIKYETQLEFYLIKWWEYHCKCYMHSQCQWSLPNFKS